MFGILLILQCAVCVAAETPDHNESSKYLDAVREFADNVLKYGRDTYGSKHTPLFVDGLNIHTHEPVKWIAPSGEKWVLSNLASQQNLFRTLDGLTRITGDPKYRQAAVEAIEYAFDNLQADNGLLYWGVAAAYDASTDTVYGNLHCMKGNHPYYELMWEVDPQTTSQFIEAFWSTHILDWSNLDMDRYTSMRKALKKPWDYEYEGGPVFFKSKNVWAASFNTTASDLYHAAAFLFKVSGQKEPLIWGKRLAHRYVETRNPKTGISGWRYSCSRNKKLPPVDESGNWILDFYTARGVPNIREAVLGRLVLSPGVFTCGKETCICQLMLGEMLGDDGKEFKQWALEELTAIGKAAYRQKDNLWIPMRTDGTSLEGVDGKVAWTANPADFWAYALAYRLTDDQFMWQMARNIGRGNGFGDIGTNREGNPSLRLRADCSNPCAILGFLELYRGTQEEQFLEMARRIGNNILAAKFHRGFFVPSEKHTYAKFDAIESLVLLNLYIAVRSEGPKPPKVWPTRVHFNAPYRQKEQTTDNKDIYALMESVEPPVSLDEAATMGNLELVKSLISHGTDVDAKDRLGRTAFSYAAENGHKDVVEILLAKGVEIDERDGFGRSALYYATRQGHKETAEFFIVNGADVNAKDNAGETPLHHAARTGRKDTAELLIAKGADVNAKNNDGQRPVEVALQRNRKDVIELLIAEGADVSSIHLAAYLGDVAKVMDFVEQDSDVNTKDQRGFTPLNYAARRGHTEIVELLLQPDSKTNAQDESGRTLRGQAANKPDGEEEGEVTQDARLPMLDVERGKYGTYLTIRSESIPGLLLDVWCYEDRLGDATRYEKQGGAVVLIHKLEEATVTTRFEPSQTGVDIQVHVTGPNAEAVQKVKGLNPCCQFGRSAAFRSEGNYVHDFVARCFVFLDAGMTLLKDTKRIPGTLPRKDDRANYPKPWIQEYFPMWRKHPGQIKGRRGYSPDRPVYPIIGVVSRDGKHLAAIAWPETTSLGQVWHHCIHPRPLTAESFDVKTGEIRSCGKIYLMENDEKKLLRQFKEDFPLWRRPQDVR